MTGSELIEWFRKFPIDYVTQDYRFIDEAILEFLNEAEREACIRSRLIFDASTPSVCSVTVIAGTSVYATSSLISDISTAFFTDGNGEKTRLHPYDRIELDRIHPDWRTTADTPSGFVYDDKYLTLNRVPSVSGTLNLEVYRLPLVDFTEGSSPEIASLHHRELVNWVCYRVLSTEDFEQLEGMQQRGLKYLAAFERYFGKKPDANTRRRQKFNQPHINKVW